ncbi:soluble lamin-associated protein of 75 kDa-like isoform X2 [Anneissia japonica]|nr:soluble lamin-associated protein of 75 kDa-like isoform X2 [Anneissia japonica]
MYVVDTIVTKEDLNTKVDSRDSQTNTVYFCKKCGNEINLSDVNVVEFSVYDTNSVRLPAIPCKSTDCPIGLLQIQGVWLSIDEVLICGRNRPNGFQKVSSTGERIALSVLNNILYKVLDRKANDPEFLPHAFNEYAKLLWINNTAVGFYTVKERGTWCGSQSQALSWQLTILDTVYINSTHRRQGHALLALHDFLKTFPDEDLGISEPVSESMMLVCKRFVKENPVEAERLWLCTLPADNSHSENLVLRIALSAMPGKHKKRKNSDPKKFVTDAEKACSVATVGSSSQLEVDTTETEPVCSAEAVDKLSIPPSESLNPVSENCSIASYEGSSNLLRNFSVIAKATIDGERSNDTARKISNPILPVQTLLKIPENDSRTISDGKSFHETFKQEGNESKETNSLAKGFLSQEGCPANDVHDIEGDAVRSQEFQDEYQNYKGQINCLPELNMDNDGSQGTSNDTDPSHSPTDFAPAAEGGHFYVKAEPIDEDDGSYPQDQHKCMMSKRKHVLVEEPSSSVVIKQEPVDIDVSNHHLYYVQQSRTFFKSDTSSIDEVSDLPLNQNLEDQLTGNADQNTRQLSLFEQMLLPSGPQDHQGSSEEGSSILQNLNQSQGMISSLLRNIAEQLKEPRTTTNREPIWQTRPTQETCEAQSSSDSQKRLRKTSYPIAKLSTHLKRKHKNKLRMNDKNFKPRAKQKDIGVCLEGPSKRTRSQSMSDESMKNRISNWMRSGSDDEEMGNSSSTNTNRRVTEKVNTNHSLDHRVSQSNSHRYSSNQLASAGCSTIAVHSSTTMTSQSSRSDFQAERPERPKRPFNVVQALTVEDPSSTQTNFPQGSLYESMGGLSNRSLPRRGHASTHSTITSSSALPSSHDTPVSVMSTANNLVGSQVVVSTQNPLIRGLLEMKVPTKPNIRQLAPAKTSIISEDASTSQDVGSSHNSRYRNLNAAATQTAQYVCELCDIIFTDSVMYVLHTGCHGRRDAYQCNQCGTICRDKYEFMIHFIQGVHNRE